jgi:starch synthase (maltosyl-transferring)
MPQRGASPSGKKTNGARGARERFPGRDGQRPLPQTPERVIISAVRPNLSCGRYAVKRIAGDFLRVTADILKEGHDTLAAEVRYRPAGAEDFRAAPMTYSYNEDEWSAEVELDEVGAFEYTVAAWTDVYASWCDELQRKVAAGRDVTSEVIEGQAIITEVASMAPQPVADELIGYAEGLGRASSPAAQIAYATDRALGGLMSRHQRRADLTLHRRWLPLVVDRERARFGAWYEMFPRSQGTKPGKPATLREAERRLRPIREMGFDVVYLPPIHPIGRTNRKGKNNSLVAEPGDVGSPWAIGNEHGGHDAIDPGLGTMEDFDHFVATAAKLGLEVAMDFAIQCSPDHPYVREHPEWFRRRPDGTIKYAENPPKKYEDIVALDMWCADYEALWLELRRVVLHWVGHGVRFFRVDNPHTKPIAFWEWLIASVKGEHPDVLFLAEAFTRPKRLQELAKIGFSQSYTYFTWRNSRHELEEYLAELTGTEQAEFLRPNFFANTPDILHEVLQRGGRPAFKLRAALAATLSPSYGIYSGFELIENTPLHVGSEEYLNSEKYEVRVRDWEAPGNIIPYITALNRARNENRALQLYTNLTFHDADNPNILSYSKTTPDGSNRILVIANMDPFAPHHATVHLDGPALGIDGASHYALEDLLTGERFHWRGLSGFVRLDPQVEPVHLFRLEPA